MEYLRSLWKENGGKSQIPHKEETSLNTSVNVTADASQQFSNVEVSVQPSSITDNLDPKVEEFFKDFPEPYRQKAIERFTKREGLHRFEVFREMAMRNEMMSARKGIFLEDQREFEEWTQEQKKEEQELARQKEKELFHSRDIPQWEQKVLKFIPLQPGDQMWLKLALSANASAFGLAFLAKWRSFSRSTPAPPRQQVVRTLIGSVGICCFFQAVAVYRLMDWGPFDRSVDDREFYVKVVDDFKRDLKIIHNQIEDKIKR